MEEIIALRKVSKVFGKKSVLKELDLCVEEGDFFGFIGPNGAGKSTTIRIILGLLKATTGQAHVFGLPAGPSQVDILKDVAYLPSEVNLYPDLTVRQILNLSASLSCSVMDSERDRLCQRFQLELDKKIKALSLGNRKKVGIVAMLMKKARLLILDEPTSGLDPFMQQIFWQEIKQKNAQGVTVFVSSHILTEVEKYCNKVALIKEGRILMAKTVDQWTMSKMKQVRLEGITGPLTLPGILQETSDDDAIEFLYQGEISSLLTYLNQYQADIRDLTIQGMDIESLLMHYYQDEEGQ